MSYWRHGRGFLLASAAARNSKCETKTENSDTRILQ